MPAPQSPKSAAPSCRKKSSSRSAQSRRLEGPVGTPIGKGFRSVNVTLRQALDLYANVRPIRSLPGVEPRFEGTDMVIVRENTRICTPGSSS